MKNPIRGLLISAVAGVACILPARHACADTVYVACALDGTIRQYATNGTGSIFARSSLGNPGGEAFDKAGNLYVANEGYNTITKFDTTASVHFRRRPRRQLHLELPGRPGL